MKRDWKGGFAAAWFAAALSFAALAVAQTSTPLPLAKPEEVGMSSQRLAKITAALKKEADEGSFRGAVVMVARKGKLAGDVLPHHRRGVERLGALLPEQGPSRAVGRAHRRSGDPEPYVHAADRVEHDVVGPGNGLAGERAKLYNDTLERLGAGVSG